MTLVCKPRGRGNWRVVRMEIRGVADLFGLGIRIRALRIGEIVVLGDLVLRICEVHP